ncbi:N(G),N(G)-dimethylarginine dimethylaminohydrolase [Actinocorallia sp. API 0066]|uniref:dimethylargininase n=1 Tax=Actinocorallia sp. API 0066 TaxID=2896846 RepID=UPI001E385182|nr:dimethylargininase [Actinocorallia sp. API 0066]MCD0449708.1 N(G),N(G)-dimethylarginine dimethylaminohydrolase [Actinocorallia sp. API 0066]
MPTLTRPVALVRPPAATLADGVVLFAERQEIDLDLARRQWAGYLAALERHGWPTLQVPGDDTLPDSVFIEDSVVMFGDLAVVTRPAAPRGPETVAVEAFVRGLGLPVATITAPATLDGGDVLKIGTRVYVGLTASTNADGVAQLAALVEPHGYTVTAVPVTRAMHLKSAVTALPDGTVIGYPPLVDDPSLFDRFLAVPEEAGAHVVLLGAALLLSSAAPETAALLTGLGYPVEMVDISEFEKLEGCVTCLSVRVR